MNSKHFGLRCPQAERTGRQAPLSPPSEAPLPPPLPPLPPSLPPLPPLSQSKHL